MKCENCNVIIIKKYGSGRFCSTQCSRGFSTKSKRSEINLKVSETITKKLIDGEKIGFCKLGKTIKVKIKKLKFEKPKIIQIRTCETCKKIFESKDKSMAKTCSPDCLKKYRSIQISKATKGNPNVGGYRIGSGHGKSCWYESKIAGRVFLDSSWELAFAKYLDANNINWKRNTTRFDYNFENKKHYYVPDFYLIETDEYIEVKGFKVKQDEAKWKYFPHKLTVLYSKELKIIGVL